MAYQLGERVWASSFTAIKTRIHAYGHIAWVEFPDGLDSPNLIYHVRFDGDKPPSVPALVLETEEEHLKNVNDRQRLDSSISK